jgi:transmembrane sensor
MVLNGMTEEYLSQLISKYANGKASAEEIRQLMDWYRAAGVGDVSWPIADAKEKDQIHDRMLARLKEGTLEEKARVVRFSWIKAAAILVIIAGLSIVYFSRNSSTSYITITNPLGKVQMIRLPDSSRVWLNASTTLQYNKSFKENRKIKLDGEAFFQVTHDPSHPFEVTAGSVTTSVLGTAFDIKAYPSETSTTVSVLNGRVQVAHGSKKLHILSASDKLVFDRQHLTAEFFSNSLAVQPGWTNGLLEFKGETFGQIAGTLERWYGVHLIFTDPALRDCRYYMSFDDKDTLEKLLSTISQLNGMQYSIDRNIITISGKRCN